MSVSSFLVPDITPPPGQPATIARAALEKADLMPLWEIAARTVVEIGIMIVVGKLVIDFVNRLGERADQVNSSGP